MLKHWRWKQLETRLPGALPNVLRSMTYRPMDKKSVPTAEAVEYLRQVLGPRTRDLSRLLDREFPEWGTW
jgi:hypothetical protein